MKDTNEMQLMQVQPMAQTPMSILNKAVESGTSVDVLEKLLALQERWGASEAKKAFDAAMSAAKAELPVLHKGNTVDFTTARGRTHYNYEDLASVARAIDPILSRHGLSYRWNTDSNEASTTVTCILSHAAGHSEFNKLVAPNDISGNKNAIQAIGSAVTYLQRYTLKAALGLSASADDDGRSVPPPAPQQARTHQPAQSAPTPMAQRKSAPEATPAAPEPHADATPAQKKAFIEAMKPIEEQAIAFLQMKGVILDTENLDDVPLDKTPKTAVAIAKTKAMIAEWSGLEAPPVDEGFVVPEGAELITGFVKMVKEKPTAKGGTNYSILVVQSMEDKEGGDWISTFDDVDGGAAGTLEGVEANLYFTFDKTGKYKNLCKRGISPVA